MNSKIIANGILRALGIILGIFLVLYFLYQIQSVIIYIAIAAVVSLIGRPVVLFLCRKLKFNNTLAVIVTMTLLVLVLLGLVSLFIPLIIEQSHNLALLNMNELQANIQDLYQQIVTYFEVNQIDVQETIKQSNLLEKIDFAIIPDLLNGLISGFGSFTIGLFSLIFGVHNAIVIAFLCALLNLIPYVGPLISASLVIILTMTSFLGQSFSDVILPKTIYVFIGFIIAQLVDNFVSQPIIFSKSVKSHPLEIFLIIIIAGILFGIIGMVVAVPTYTAIKVILKEFLSENKIVKRLTKDL